MNNIWFVWYPYTVHWHMIISYKQQYYLIDRRIIPMFVLHSMSTLNVSWSWWMVSWICPRMDTLCLSIIWHNFLQDDYENFNSKFRVLFQWKTEILHLRFIPFFVYFYVFANIAPERWLRFCRWYFQMHFLKIVYSNLNFTVVCSNESNWQ